MTNQEWSREALIEHIAEQDRVIRVRNVEIAALRKRAEKAERERDEARRERDSWRAQVPLADWEKDLIQATENPRPLTPGAIEVALHDCMPSVAFDRLSATQVMRLAEDMHAALIESRPLSPDAITDEMVERALAVERRVYDDGYTTEPGTMRELLAAALTEPPRPEGAEKVEAVLHQYWSGDIDGDDLADRIAEEMNR